MVNERKKLTIVNRHYPPNLNVTGENVWDLASFLIKEHNIEVHIVHVDREYTGGGYQRQAVGVVHKVDTIYTGNNRMLRYLAGLWDGYFLIRKAKRIGNYPIIVLTSPPMLPMWASMMLANSNWILWSMDLFPEGFAAVNEIKRKVGFISFFINIPTKMLQIRLLLWDQIKKRSWKKSILNLLKGRFYPVVYLFLMLWKLNGHIGKLTKT